MGYLFVNSTLVWVLLFRSKGTIFLLTVRLLHCGIVHLKFFFRQHMLLLWTCGVLVVFLQKCTIEGVPLLCILVCCLWMAMDY